VCSSDLVENRDAADNQIANIVTQREALQAALQDCVVATQVWRSEANFVLARFANLPAVLAAMEKHRILIRTLPNDPLLEDCARISVGMAADTESLVSALRNVTVPLP
jgi:histidinol-phosphate aminotransferase